MIHFTQNGHINTTQKREAKSKKDVHWRREKLLGEEIKNITGCEVLIDIIPLWENGEAIKL